MMPSTRSLPANQPRRKEPAQAKKRGGENREEEETQKPFILSGDTDTQAICHSEASSSPSNWSLLLTLAQGLWWLIFVFGWMIFPAFGLLVRGIAGLSDGPEQLPAANAASVTRPNCGNNGLPGQASEKKKSARKRFH